VCFRKNFQGMGLKIYKIILIDISQTKVAILLPL